MPQASGPGTLQTGGHRDRRVLRLFYGHNYPVDGPYQHELAIYFTQVPRRTAQDIVVGYRSERAYFMSDSYGAGSTSTAC